MASMASIASESTPPLPDERTEEHRPAPLLPAPDRHPGDPSAPPPEPPSPAG